MILVHLADLHLGHRAYGRSAGGRNLRERDVARAFREAVKEIVRLEPALVLIAGDVFERPEPPAGALVVLARGLETLRSSLPETPVLMAAGARDTPRGWGDPGALAALDTFPNVEAATGTPRSVRVRDGEAHVLLVPHRAVLQGSLAELRPDPDARWNVLVAYGAAGFEGTWRPVPGGGAGGEPPPRSAESGSGTGRLELETSAWDYVALGYDHRFRELAPGVVYAGSLERVGPEPWTEAHRPKGFVWADLESGEAGLREIRGRPVVALAPIRWDPERPERANERIREVSREVPGGLEDKIVLLRLEGMGPAELQRLDAGLLTSLRSRAVHLAVEVEGQDPRGPGPSVADRVIAHLSAEGDEGEALRELTRRLLAESEADGRVSP